MHSGGELGVSFSPVQSGGLSEIRVAIGTASESSTTAVTLHLRADATGTPGSSIESYFVAGQIPFEADEVGPFSLYSSTAPLLEAGQTYWLTVETYPDGAIAGYPDSDVIWHNAHFTTDEMPTWIGNQTLRFPGTSTFLVGGQIDNAFQVYVNVVPIPAAAWLFGSALGLLGVVGGRRPT